MARKKLRFADLEPVGAGTPAGRYLRRFWHPVCVARDLPSGRAKPIEVLGEKFTLYRGESGNAYVVAFRCAHRGVQLATGWVEGDDIRCRYHGWKFDCSGQCVEQPNEEKPFAEKVRIRGYPTREYVGLIFAFLGDGEAPPFPEYADLNRPGVITTDPPEVVPCSYWNRLDNDHSHVAWTHRATSIRKGLNAYLLPRHEKVEETAYGWKSKRYLKGDSTHDWALSGTANFFMPNVYQFWAHTRTKGFEGRDLWDAKFTWTVPINDSTFAAFDVTNTPVSADEARAYAASRLGEIEQHAASRFDLAEKVLAGDMTLEDLPDDMDANTSFIIEDYVMQVGQGSIADRGVEQLALTDSKVILLRRLWLREVTALLEGRPLTNWEIPAEPLEFEVVNPG